MTRYYTITEFKFAIFRIKIMRRWYSVKQFGLHTAVNRFSLSLLSVSLSLNMLVLHQQSCHLQTDMIYALLPLVDVEKNNLSQNLRYCNQYLSEDCFASFLKAVKYWWQNSLVGHSEWSDSVVFNQPRMCILCRGDWQREKSKRNAHKQQQWFTYSVQSKLECGNVDVCHYLAKILSLEQLFTYPWLQ